MMNKTAEDAPLWRRAIAYWCYAWGASWCYWGLRTSEQTFFRAGVTAFGRAIWWWPAFSGGYYRRGVIRSRELGQHREGIADLTRAIELAPGWAELYLHRGLLHRFHGDPQLAITDLEHYLTFDTNSSWRGEAKRQLVLLRAELDEDRKQDDMEQSYG